MAQPGRGRGEALFTMIKLRQQQQLGRGGDTSDSVASPDTTQPPSAASSEVAAPTSITAGRGRASLILSRLQAQRPGGATSTAESEVSSVPSSQPSAPVAEPPRGAGRGQSLFKHLDSMKKLGSSGSSGASASSGEGAGDADVASVASKLEGTAISEVTAAISGVTTAISEVTTANTLKPKNKYIREVKDTPPVVKLGQSGRPVELTANFIRMEVQPGMGVFEYEVDYKPQQDLKGYRIKLLNMHLDVIGRTKTFDGTTLYLPVELPQEVTRLTSKHPTEDYNVEVKIIFRRQRRMGEVIHLYNVLFKNIQRELKLIRYGRQYFNPATAIIIPQHKLQVWPGYVTAVDEYEGGLMLTLDSTHRVLRTETVLHLMRDLAMKDKVHFRDNFVTALVGSSVMTTYSKALYRVDDVAYDMNPMSKFTSYDGTKISFVHYYKENYGVEIVDLDQPLLISRQKRSRRQPDGTESKEDVLVNLVPELCQLTGLSDDQRSNFRLMKDVASYTRITPNQRMCAFKKFLESVDANENCRSLLSRWGLRISPDTIPLTGRVLPPENLTFGNGRVVKGAPNAEWNRDATNNELIEAIDLLNWVVIYSRKDTNCTQDFVETLRRCGPPMGIRVNAPALVMLPSDGNSAYASALNSVITDTLQLVVAVCPSARDDRYAVIKKICNCSRPIPSQVINARTIMNREKMRAIVQKIALQMNCKLGGTLWSVSIPFKSAMIVGIDSYHETARKNRSVCGFIASYNAACTHWFSKVVIQKPGQEVVDGLKACLCEALTHYRNVNGFFPDKVIIYRDGVGDGQLNELLRFEVQQMQACFQTVKEDYAPMFTFIVVQKRINTRLFLKLNGRLDNPPPGTVLDHDITRRDWYDFLIVPQKVGQGTVTPSHYIVIADDSNMTPDHVQRLTYKMCHLYYNWPGTVRVPAPCQYAHKLAFLVGQSMKEPHNAKLNDKLFFL